MPEIKKEYLKHNPQTGYVLVKADENFQALEKPKFIQRGINKQLFRNIFGFPPNNDTSHGENNWIYFEVYWSHSRTSWYLKEFYYTKDSTSAKPLRTPV